MEREACVCDHGYERSDLCAEIIIIIIIIPQSGGKNVKTFGVVVSHIPRIACQPEKTTPGYLTRRWPIPLRTAKGEKITKRESLAAYPPPPPTLLVRRK